MIQIHEDVKFVLKKLEQKDEFDYLILAINFSRSDSIINNSPTLARQEALKNSKHLILGFVQTGCLLIGDPDRLVSAEKYKLECPADRYTYDQDPYRIWGLYYILSDIGGINTLSYGARDSAYAEPWSCMPIATLE